MGDDTLLGQALSMRGLVLFSQERPDLVDVARAAILTGVDANRRGGQPSSRAYSLEGLAAVALADGLPGVAAQALAAAGAAHLATPLSTVLPLLVDPLAARARGTTRRRILRSVVRPRSSVATGSGAGPHNGRIG